MDINDNDGLGEGQEVTDYDITPGAFDMQIIDELGFVPASIVQTVQCQGICEHCAHPEPLFHVALVAGDRGLLETLILN
jgi:hypothetical protein